MKKAVLIFLLASGASCLAGLDGRYLRDLTRDYVTPHLEWASKLNGGPVKTLFIVSRLGAREAVETAERMEIDLNAVTAVNAIILAAENGYESAVEGTTVHEKTTELMAKLDGKYDLFVLGNFPLDKLPPEAALKILRQVMDGSGLVIVYPYETKLKKIFAKPFPAGAAEILSLAPGKDLSKLRNVSESVLLNTYELGKGRIAQIDYRANHPGFYVGLTLTAPNSFSDRWRADYENNMVLVLRAMKWAAQRDPAISISCPELAENAVLPQKAQSLKIDLKSEGKFDGAIVLRIRDEFNAVLDSKEIACKFTGETSIAYAIPQLAGGKYYLDLIAKSGGKTDNFGCRPFAVASPVKVDITAPDVIRQHGTINAELKLNNPLDSAEVEVSLKDSPYGRVWFKQKYKLDSSGTLPVKIEGYHLPALAGYLKCEVTQQGQVLATNEKLLFFPDYRLEDYLEYCWNGIGSDYIAALSAERIVDGLGWRAGLEAPYPDGVNVAQSALLNQRSIPYILRIVIGAGEKGECKQFSWAFKPPEQAAAQKALGGDESFADPEVRKLWQELVKTRMTNLPRYGPAIYSLGDENAFSYEAGFGKADGAAFADFLSQKYGTVGALKMRAQKQNAGMSRCG